MVAEVARASANEAHAAIERSQRAFKSWKQMAPGKRAELLRIFGVKVREANEELARLEVANSGHTIANARWEANNVADTITYYAGAVERMTGYQIPVPGGVDITFLEPVGVVGVIVPWNFPMPIAGWGFAPALAAGATVVLKPAEVTPLTALRIAELALEAGIPEDVFQVVTGSGSVVGEALVEDPLVRKIVFTGSTEVGIGIQQKAARQIKRVTLELGGKSANIVFADSDIAKAAATAPYSVFDNAGQDCCARSRILVEESAYDEFMAGLEEAVSNLRVEDPSHDSSEMGPLITAAHRKSVERYVDESLVLFRGSIPDGRGFWYPPTVIGGVDRDHQLFREEVFGPVVTVSTFKDEAEAIELANDSDYGLSGSIWTSNLGKGLRVARGVESGNLSVNSHSSVRYWTPFGGYKMSGLGRELGPDAPNAFCEVKNVFISTEI
ncbi:MAG: aldehyde dehydrogenase family protein [Actinomycetota bacterium]|nr:aldehyde dehydrogenase family protein [Actinomycetota bacterium]